MKFRLQIIRLLWISSFISVTTIIADDNYGAKIENNHGIVNISHKGNNYLEENPSSKIKKISKSYENYDIELKGRVNISKKFKPFRIDIENEDPDDPGEWVYSETLNMKKPFYTLNTKIMNDLEYTEESHAIYNRCTEGEECNEIHGYVYRIKITNMTDYGEDMIIRNKVLSSIKRKGNAYRVLSAWDMGGGGDYIKLNKDIPLEEGSENFKFKNSDFISLRNGESIILAIPYIAKKQGVYSPSLTLDIRYASTKGKLKINLPDLVVPKLFAWVGYLDNKAEILSDKEHLNKENFYGRMYWYLFDEKTHEVKPFSFSQRKLTKDELRFMGKTYCWLFRNELFALKGAKFKTKFLEEYFFHKFDEWTNNIKYEPRIPASEILPNQLTEIERYNVKLALEIEKELK